MRTTHTTTQNIKMATIMAALLSGALMVTSCGDIRPGGNNHAIQAVKSYVDSTEGATLSTVGRWYGGTKETFSSDNPDFPYRFMVGEIEPLHGSDTYRTLYNVKIEVDIARAKANNPDEDKLFSDATLSFITDSGEEIVFDPDPKNEDNHNMIVNGSLLDGVNTTDPRSGHLVKLEALLAAPASNVVALKITPDDKFDIQGKQKSWVFSLSR